MVGGIRLITYESRVTRRCGASGHGASVVAAPPSEPRASRTSVRAPDLARYAADDQPVVPAADDDRVVAVRHPRAPDRLTDCSI